jgi:hypothetical protein
LDVAQCKDGTFSDNKDFSATCNSHNGVDHWLGEYGQCSDGKIIVMSSGASCGSGTQFTGFATSVDEATKIKLRLHTSCDSVTDVAVGKTRVTVTAKAGSNLTEGLTKDSARICIADILEDMQTYGTASGWKSVEVKILSDDLTDRYGATLKDQLVITARYSSDTVTRIVFSNIDKRKILPLADSQTVVPAFAKGDGS